MTDNLNFGNPYKPEAFYPLQECIRGLADACRHFDVPVVGGNVSLYNESPAGAIDPTPTVSVVGLVEEESWITRSWVREGGERLILLGGAPSELGGSQFLGLIHGLKTGDAPAVDLAAEQRLHALLRAQIAAGRVRAAHDLSEGGLLVALAEMLFGPNPGGGELGARVDLRALPAPRWDGLLFGESQGRAIVAVRPADAAAVLAAARAAGVPAESLGESSADGRLRVETAAGLLDWETAALRHGWETAIETAMRRPGIDGA
jgi:phosphoribosylformylglycinamidine synthase